MRKVLVLSPHFDDAVLSAGQFLAGRPDADVVTVFGGMPKQEQTTPYDDRCGFKNSTVAVHCRRLEDDEALALLQAESIYWDFVDEQYDEPTDNSVIGKKILEQLEKEDYEFVLCPIGLGHPDHEQLADTVREIEHYIDIPVYYWEDLPLRVVMPEIVPERIEKLGLTKLVNIGDGPIVDKIRSLSCYKSQIGTGILNPHVMYVPERFWQ